MRILVDTDWVINYLKGRAETIRVMQSLAGDGLAISLITYGEIYEGIYGSADPLRHEVSFNQFLRGVDVLPLTRVTREIMQRFAKIRLKLRSQGLLIGDPDILIAATAMHHNLQLLSTTPGIFSAWTVSGYTR